jgi:hypothetical protein
MKGFIYGAALSVFLWGTMWMWWAPEPDGEPFSVLLNSIRLQTLMWFALTSYFIGSLVCTQINDAEEQRRMRRVTPLPARKKRRAAK